MATTAAYLAGAYFSHLQTQHDELWQTYQQRVAEHQANKDSVPIKVCTLASWRVGELARVKLAS